MSNTMAKLAIITCNTSAQLSCVDFAKYAIVAAFPRL
jgi:hypothetical protein